MIELRNRAVTSWCQIFVSCLLLTLCESAIKAQEIPILVYHRFNSAIPGLTTVRTSTLESQLEWFEDHHYQILPLRTVIDKLRIIGDRPGTQMVAITIDDGHRSVYTEMFPLILKHHIPVTLFVYPSAISKASYALTWEQIREMKESGLVNVQSHTLWHPNFREERARLSNTEYEAFVDKQLTTSRLVLSSRVGVGDRHSGMAFWNPRFVSRGRCPPDIEPHSHLKGARLASAAICSQFHEYQFQTTIPVQSSAS